MSDESSGPAPLTVRTAGAVVAVQGALSLVLAVVLVLRTLAGGGGSTTIGYGTAAMFAVLGAGVLAAGVALLRSFPGGRGPALVVQVLLLPVAWSLLTDSAQVLLGAVLAVVAVLTVALLLWGPSRRWVAEQHSAPPSPPE